MVDGKECSRVTFVRLDKEALENLAKGRSPRSQSEPEGSVDSIETRPAGVRDIETVRSLQEMLVHEINASDPHFPRDQKEMSRVTEEELRNPHVLVMLAIVGSAPVGYLEAYAALTAPPLVEKPYGHIRAVFVRPGYRQQGIGSTLMSRAIPWFRRKQVEVVTLNVLGSLRTARRFAMSFGFDDYQIRMAKRM
jgi:GNAT superfamily N-acetyltransferase